MPPTTTTICNFTHTESNSLIPYIPSEPIFSFLSHNVNRKYSRVEASFLPIFSAFPHRLTFTSIYSSHLHRNLSLVRLVASMSSIAPPPAMIRSWTPLHLYVCIHFLPHFLLDPSPNQTPRSNSKSRRSMTSAHLDISIQRRSFWSSLFFLLADVWFWTVKP